MGATNEELVLKFQQGQISFDVVYDHCRAMIHKEAGRWRIKGMDYDDKVSILMEAFWEACLRYDGRADVKFSSFCITHLRYVIRDHWRRESTLSSSKYKVLSADGMLSFKDRQLYDEGLIRVSVAPDQAVIDQYLLELIDESLDRIPEPGRTYTCHFLLDDMNKFEVAKQYGIKNQNLHYHLSRALKIVQRHLIRNGWVD